MAQTETTVVNVKATVTLTQIVLEISFVEIAAQLTHSLQSMDV